MDLEYRPEPSPHVVIPQLLADDVYEALVFPEIPVREGGRIGRDMYASDPGYAEVLAEPGWRELASTFTSAEFVDRVVKLFSPDMLAAGCLVDPDRAYLDPYAETREETETSVLATTGDPNALFTRFDLQAASSGYSKTPHCDWPRRLVGGVLFLSSAAEEGLVGGEFGLYADDAFEDDRRCHQPRLVVSYPMEHNMGVLFLNSNRGFHGPTPIQSLTGLRRWVYFSISSRRDVWPAAPPQERRRSSRFSAFLRSKVGSLGGA